MRVLMREVIDVDTDLTTKQLTIRQKFSVLWQSLLSESKIIGNRKKAEAEKELKARNLRIDSLRDGLLASIEYHLTQNNTLEEFNEQAAEIQFAVERRNQDILAEVLASHEFNTFEVGYVSLDADLVNSFGSVVPIIVSFRQREV